MAKCSIIFSDEFRDVSGLLADYPAVFIVADRKLRHTITEPLAETLAEDGVALRGVLDLRTSERCKNLETVGKINGWLLEAGADRDALVLAVGGGIITDLAGFAAATYKRGIRYASVPTTLLAQVDASIGGKTGCNVNGYKNICGAFLMPEFTFICPPLTRSLDWNEFISGYAEMLKTFIVADPDSYEKAVAAENFDNLGDFIRRAAEIKGAIVEEDFRDRGRRRLLNLGHTFGHAIETRSHGRIPHGKAVAAGIIMAAELSEREGVCRPGLAGKIREDFEKAGLPTGARWSPKDLAQTMLKDKKAAGGKVNFVLVRDVGDCIIRAVDPLEL